MKRSIKRQMTVMFAGLTVCILATIFIINAFFLEPYYIRNKQRTFVETYELIQSRMVDGNKSLEEVAISIYDHVEAANISFFISDSSQGKAVSSMQNMERTEEQLFGFFVENPWEQGKVLTQAPIIRLFR